MIKSGPEGRPRSGHCRRTETSSRREIGRDSANEQPRRRITEQRQSGERSSECSGSDQNAGGRIGEEIEHENQVMRPHIPVDGRVVSKDM